MPTFTQKCDSRTWTERRCIEHFYQCSLFNKPLTNWPVDSQLFYANRVASAAERKWPESVAANNRSAYLSFLFVPSWFMVVLNLFGPLCPRQNAFDTFRKSVRAFFNLTPSSRKISHNSQTLQKSHNIKVLLWVFSLIWRVC